MPSFWDNVFDLGEAYLTDQGPSSPSYPTTNLPAVMPATTVPMPGIPVRSNGSGSCGPAPVYRLKNGVYQWTTPTRKRRKRLAPPSVVADIAALKAVLTGKQLETYLATHPC